MCCVTLAELFPHHTHTLPDPREKGRVAGCGDVFSTERPLVKATEAVGVKLPLVEKETERCRQSTSQYLSEGVHKHPPLLNNHTPHRKVCTKTQNKNCYNKERQGSPPPSCSARERGGDDGAPEDVTSGSSIPGQAVNHPETQDLEVMVVFQLHTYFTLLSSCMPVQL